MKRVALHLVAPGPAVEEDDETVLVRMARGERSAFGIIARRFAPRLARFCARHAGDAAVGEDLAHDVLILMWEARQSFRGGDPAAWVFTIALNRCRKHTRGFLRWLRAAPRAPSRADSPPATLHEQLERRQLAAFAHQAMCALPELERAAISLRLEAELDYRAIGDVLGCTEGAARVRVFTALKKARAIMESTT